MNLFMSKLKRVSEYVAMVILFVAAFFSLLYYIGNFNGDFMPVIGNLFAMALKVGIWLIVPLCIALKRRSYARWASLGVSLYWLITDLFYLLEETKAAKANPPLIISVGVFSFLTACCLIVMTVFALVGVIRKQGKTKMVALCVYAGALLFYLVLFALNVACSAKWGDAWNEYFDHLCRYLLIPFAMLFVAIAFGFRDEEFVLPFKEKAAVPKPALPAPAANSDAPEEEDEIAAELEEPQAPAGEEEPPAEEIPVPAPDQDKPDGE